MQKRLVVLGAGESGVGAALLAKKHGFSVFVSDFGRLKPQYEEELQKNNIEFESGAHSENIILNATIVVKSPGISENCSIISKVRKQGIPVISEIEFAGQFYKGKTICITGSNGKTTTTTLLYNLLKRANLNVGVGGNIGQSFARQIADKNFDWFVLELSSFQLDGMYDFKADIAILLNITPDHLDRYEYNLQNYVDSKFRIIQNLTNAECFIYFADDPIIKEEIKIREINAQKLPFTISGNPEAVAELVENKLKLSINKENLSLPIEELSLGGKHNACNSMAAGISGLFLNITKEDIRNSLTNFKGVEHRLETVTTNNGIEYINDSKATNINSTWYALESMTRPTIWIVGGVDKGNDYSELFSLVRSKVKAIICLGKDNKKIIKAFEHFTIPICETNSMEQAIESSKKISKVGDCVLLSPACASFDLFENYEERGTQFKKLVL